MVEMRRIFPVFLLVAGLWTAACSSGSTPTNPTTPSAGATSFTQVMSGTITAGTPIFHSFSLPSTAPLHVMLGSLTSPTEAPLGSSVSLIYGIVAADGVTCLALAKVPATAALTAQINVTASSGGYCVSLDDLGSVPDGSLYAIRVIYGTPTEDRNAGEIPYTSSVLAGGTTSRSFPAAFDGMATVTMDSIAPATVPNLGLALGFQRNDGSGCTVTFAYIAPPGFSTSVPVDAGKYCVKVFDPGTLTNTTAFSVKISHP
jgi:hypothetical protein